MLQPSYSELMDVIRQSDKLDKRVTSRYTVVLAAAKRARQLTEGANPLTYAPTDRAVSIAVKEMQEGKLRIRVNTDLLEEAKRVPAKFRAISAVGADDLREELKDNDAPSVYKLEDDDGDEIFAPGSAFEEAAADYEDEPALIPDEFEDEE
jgi:DNA-directed RNA polymerase subunit omega